MTSRIRSAPPWAVRFDARAGRPGADAHPADIDCEDLIDLFELVRRRRAVRAWRRQGWRARRPVLRAAPGAS